MADGEVKRSTKPRRGESTDLRGLDLEQIVIHDAGSTRQVRKFRPPPCWSSMLSATLVLLLIAAATLGWISTVAVASQRNHKSSAQLLLLGLCVPQVLTLFSSLLKMFAKECGKKHTRKPHFQTYGAPLPPIRHQPSSSTVAPRSPPDAPPVRTKQCAWSRVLPLLALEAFIEATASLCFLLRVIPALRGSMLASFFPHGEALIPMILTWIHAPRSFKVILIILYIMTFGVWCYLMWGTLGIVELVSPLGMSIGLWTNFLALPKRETPAYLYREFTQDLFRASSSVFKTLCKLLTLIGVGTAMIGISPLVAFVQLDVTGGGIALCILLLPSITNYLSWTILAVCYNYVYLMSALLIVPVATMILPFTAVCGQPFLIDPYTFPACATSANWWWMLLHLVHIYSLLVVMAERSFWKAFLLHTLPSRRDIWARPMHADFNWLLPFVLNRRPRLELPGGIAPVTPSPSSSRQPVPKGAHKVEKLVFVNVPLYQEDKEEMDQLLESFRSLALRPPIGSHVEMHICMDGINRTKNHKFAEYLDQSIAQVHGTVNGLKYSLEHTARKVRYGWVGEIRKFAGSNSTLFIHYKNPGQVLRRKRWSQVLFSLILQARLRSVAYKWFFDVVPDAAQRIFVLMTDGDIIFKPEAVAYMLDRIMRSPNVAGVAARLYPQGHGLFAWMQQFEYAISHWLHKTAESQFGSVLCASSCFSLYRWCALESIMADFARKPRTADEYQQYEQGEDRWMCTLLIKRGWSLVYCAAASAHTFCPVTFTAFFVQRRRWVMSTLCNIRRVMDESTQIVSCNESISSLFIFYIYMQYLSSLFSPAVSMIVLYGGWEVAYPNSTMLPVFFGIVFPVGFLLFCVFCCPRGTVIGNPSHRKNLITDPLGDYASAAFKAWRQRTQLRAAALLSAIYAVVMFIALVGVAQQIVNSIVAPVSIFLALVIAIIVMSALFHCELKMLGCGVVYLMGMIGTQVILVIFVFCNADNLDWGTREGTGDETNFISPIQQRFSTVIPCIRFIIRLFCECCFPAQPPPLPLPPPPPPPAPLAMILPTAVVAAPLVPAESPPQMRIHADHTTPSFVLSNLLPPSAIQLHIHDEAVQLDTPPLERKRSSPVVEEEKKEKEEKEVVLDWWDPTKTCIFGSRETPTYINAADLLTPSGDHVPEDVFEFRNSYIIFFSIANGVWLALILAVTRAGLTFGGTNAVGLFVIGLYALTLCFQHLSMLRDRVTCLMQKIASHSWPTSGVLLVVS